MDMKVQDSRSGKALDIGELFASACSASATLDRSSISYHHMKARGIKRSDHKIMPGS